MCWGTSFAGSIDGVFWKSPIWRRELGCQFKRDVLRLDNDYPVANDICGFSPKGNPKAKLDSHTLGKTQYEFVKSLQNEGNPALKGTQ